MDLSHNVAEIIPQQYEKICLEQLQMNKRVQYLEQQLQYPISNEDRHQPHYIASVTPASCFSTTTFMRQTNGDGGMSTVNIFSSPYACQNSNVPNFGGKRFESNLNNCKKFFGESTGCFRTTPLYTSHDFVDNKSNCLHQPVKGGAHNVQYSIQCIK